MISLGSVVGIGLALGYFIGFMAKDLVFTTDVESAISSNSVTLQGDGTIPLLPAGKKWPGDTVHTLLTCDGGPYQDFQTRIMYASYKMVQKMPGGEKMTGFTRILHRTEPDLLMNEIPTWHVWDLWHPECDTGCYFPVINRPNVVMQFMRAAAQDASLVKGAWLLLAESDYLWMQPVMAPGNAYDPSVAGEQYLFDYIMPQHPDAAPHIQKLYGPDEDINDVPASGPAPVMIRLEEWLIIGADYERLTYEMELAPEIVAQLAWVREMYTWDVACAMHPEITIKLLKPPNSTLMLQSPFDSALNKAAFCHYTWGALFYDKPPSQGGTNIYSWNKREYMTWPHVVKPPHMPIPPEFKEGLFLTFDQELTRPRHELVVRYIEQFNKAVDTSTDLTAELEKLPEQVAAYKQTYEARLAAKIKGNMRYVQPQ